MMRLPALSALLTLGLLATSPSVAAAPHRHSAATHNVLRAGTAAARQITRAAKTARQAADSSPGKRTAPAQGIGGASSLPPTAPTVLKPKQGANAAPSLPAAAANAATTPAVAPSARLTAAEIRAQAAPADAAPLNPKAPDVRPASSAPKPTVVRPAASVNAIAPASAAVLPNVPVAAPNGPPVPAALVPGNNLGTNPRTNPGPAARSTAAAASPATIVPAPPKVANLPPGPLTSSPVGITATPNEVRISGLGSSSAPWSIVLLLTVLTLIPSILICVTPFARLLVVFHFLRQALGLQTTPSNQTLIGLTLILTFFIMEPVGKQIYQDSFLPLQSGQITPFEALARGKEPMREFMVHFVREKDAALFLEIAKEPRPRNLHDLSMRVLVPAYIVSELKSGFQIGAVLFLPFLVVDMVVASITTSVGMMQLPPVVISTPLKLLLFLMVDGWHLLIGALVRSFN